MAPKVTCVPLGWPLEDALPWPWPSSQLQAQPRRAKLGVELGDMEGEFSQAKDFLFSVKKPVVLVVDVPNLYRVALVGESGIGLLELVNQAKVASVEIAHDFNTGLAMPEALLAEVR